MLLLKETLNPAGIDISDSIIRMVQLDKKKNKIILKSVNERQLKKGIIEDGVIKKNDEFSNELKALVAKPKFGMVGSRDVVVSLPESKSYLKYIEIEKSPNKMEDLIENEIIKHIPYSLDEIYYDWQIVEKKPDKFNILVGIAPKTVVNSYLEAFKQAGLSVVAFEIEPESICRCLIPEENPEDKSVISKNYIVIDIGATKTCLIIYANKTIVLSISLPISGNLATTQICEALELDYAQAEKAKIMCGLDKNSADGIINGILIKKINKLLAKIQDSIAFFDNNFPGAKIDKILLCGGGANIKNLPQTIEKSLGIPTELADPFLNLEKPSDKIIEEFFKKNISIKTQKGKSASVKPNFALSYTTAIGLALRPIFISEA